MANIEIYSKIVCPYCNKAKALFVNKGAKFIEINLDNEPDRRDEMLEKSDGARTVPQIFIDGKHIGGCDDLYALNAKGELDPLLS